MQNTYVNDLIAFIKANADWREKLLDKPFSLKNIVDVPYHKDWYMLNYNLFESELSNPIVKACRGTIMEISPDRSVVKAICLPYYKFFNYDDVNGDTINWNTAKVRNKADGQLIKMFKYEGQNYWCTNGSPNVETPLDYTDEKIHNYKELLFESIRKDLKQTAVSSWSDDNGNFYCKDIDWVNKIPDGWTLMFELTSPYNRIIVEYKEIKLWFHGARDENGIEHDPEEIAERFGIPYEIPKQFNFKDFDQAFAVIKDWKGLENEGLVVCDADFHRVKVKCDDYLKVKFIRDISTPKGIFWIVISEAYDDLTSHPEIQELAEKQKDELLEVMNKFRELHKDVQATRSMFEDQKSYALWVNKEHPGLSRFYFSAAKKSEQDFIDGLMDSLKSETSGYDKYLELKKLLVIM
jgi:hypothetical protein